VLREDDRCFYADEDAISPLWKGRRFPIDECISGWAMTHRQAAAIADIRVDPRIPQEAYRPAFVRSLVMVPIGGEEPLGAIGAYWAHPHHADAAEVTSLASLAAATATALGRVKPEHATA
jgi:hypothetical protein